MTKTTKLSVAARAKLAAAQDLMDQASIMLDQLRVELHGTNKDELLSVALTELEHAIDNVSDVRRR